MFLLFRDPNETLAATALSAESQQFQRLSFHRPTADVGGGEGQDNSHGRLHPRGSKVKQKMNRGSLHIGLVYYYKQNLSSTKLQREISTCVWREWGGGEESSFTCHSGVCEVISDI